MNKNIKGAVLTLFGGACWGLSGFTGQYLFTVEGMDSTWLVPIRLGFAGLILLLYNLIRNGGAQVIAPFRTWKGAFKMIVYGLFGISFCQFAYFLTIQLSSAATATILQELAPVYILIFVCLSTRRKPTVLEIAAIVLAVLGVFLLATHGDLTALSFSPLALISGIITGLCVMIYNVTAKGITDTYPVSLVQGWAFLMGSIFFTLVFHPWTIDYTPTAVGYAGIAIVVLIGNIVAFVSYITGVSLIGPERSILYAFSEPVTAAILSCILLSTPFTLYDALGYAVIFVMLILISKNTGFKSKNK